MKDNFTIKNLFYYWLKSWPIAVALTILGLVFGIFFVLNSNRDITFSTESTIFTLNNSINTIPLDHSAAITILPSNASLSINTIPLDHSAVINSPSFLEQMTTNTNLDKDSCQILADKSESNTIRIKTTCTTNPEDLEKLSQEILSDHGVKATLNNLYGEGKIEIKSLGQKPTRTIVTGPSNTIILVVSIIAGFIASIAIAFVRFDFASSKPKK